MLERHTKLGVKAWARPKRLAFLIPEDFENRDLNHIVRYCVSHFGGRSSAIIPVRSDSIQAAWEKLLVALDPDILYAFIPISPEFRKHLNNRLRPARIIEAEDFHRRDNGWSISEQDIEGTSLLLVDPPYRPQQSLPVPVVQQIISDHQFDQNSDDSTNFCLRNFGALPHGFWKAFELESKGLKVLPPVILQEPPRFLTSMLSSQGKVFPINFSACGFEQDMYRPDLREHDELYEVVIGDSVADFAYAWNRGISTQFNWRRRALWIPSAYSKSDEMISSAAEWVKDCVLRSSEAQCKIVSYTELLGDLQSFAQKIQPQIFIRASCGKFESDQVFDLGAASFSGCSKNGQRFELGQSDTIFDVPCPNGMRAVTLGRQGWVVEMEFESPASDLFSTFRSSIWHLPIRSKLDKKFIDRYRGSRISARGHLVVETHTGDRNIPIRIPGPKQLADALITDLDATGRGDDAVWTSGEFIRIDTSIDGQYFGSILQLFGNLRVTRHFLEDKCWRTVLFDMIGDKQNLRDDVDTILETFIKQQAISKKSTSAKTKATRLLVDQIVNMPAESRYIHRSRILEIFLADEMRMPDQVENRINRDLSALLSRGIIMQGTAARCNSCRSQRWYRVDEFKTQMTCQNCTAQFFLDPIDAITFRLNQLVLDGFRRYGFLPVFQSLLFLESIARHHFIFVPQQDLFHYEDDDNSLTDLDLVGILDGKYFIGEVKSSEKGLLKINIDQLIKIAEDLHPDLIFLAAPAAAFTEKARLHCLPLFEKFKNTAIQPTDMQLRWPVVVQMVHDNAPLDYQI